MCEPDVSKLQLSIGVPDRKDSTGAPSATSGESMESPIVAKHMSLRSEGQEGVCSRVASARSSGSSSAYYSSTSSCFDFQLASTPIPALGSISKRRTRLSCEQDLSSIFLEGKEDKDEGVGQATAQPSLKMIRRLKRMSDAWSRVSRSSDNDAIIDRLKKGREEAQRRQIYIEVRMVIMYISNEALIS